MGRKRDQGKARKAAKAKAKQAAEERGNNQAASNELEQSLAAQTQRMQIGECMHGIDHLSSREISSQCQFMSAFFKPFEEARGSDTPLPDCLLAARDATMEEYADVWNDSTKMEVAMSCLLCEGTNFILKDKYDHASQIATAARYFEQHIAVVLEENQAMFRWNKLYEAHIADQNTLVKFFRRRIPCSCLDEKYEEVKKITEMGLCYNPLCNCPGGRVEYSKTMYCDGCRCVTYCSRECQKADWSKHKSKCEECAAAISKFEARKKQS